MPVDEGVVQEAERLARVEPPPCSVVPESS